MGGILEANGLTVSCEGHKLLDRASIELYEKQMHLVIGKNGAGKSMLMKCLAGLQKSDSGTILLDGREQQSYSLADARKKGIFMLFHDIALLSNLTVMENIFMKRWLKKWNGWINWKKQTEEVEAILKRLNINIRSDAIVGKLSMAEQRMIEIAKAVLFQARVLILDESFSELTDVEADKVFAILERIRDNGAAVCVVTHNYSKMFERADQISIMREGRIVATVGADEASMALKEVIPHRKSKYPKVKTIHTDKMLQVIGLAGEYALKEISFEAKRGEILGITGMMGSGRTCLARLLTGVERPTKGEIIYKGKRRRFRSVEDVRKLGIVYLPENNRRAIVPEFLAAQNITLGNLNKISKRGFIDLKLERHVGDDYCRRLGIDSLALGKKSKDLSYGGIQKVVWAKDILAESSLFVMDEPTKGLDSATKVDVYNIMNVVARKGGTVIMLSSNYEELIAMCDRILILRDGKIASELVRDEINAENIVKYSYG
ncbi:ribose import ATP-binding protein RbsA [Bacteroidia bacterium]|nr:ribose import ATP-binding protein RbsA [Bacteroidia bacterium]